MAKAVVDGILHHVSPSQVKTYDACPRKWFLEKVAHVGEAPTEATTRGQSIHKQVENHLATGSPVEDGSMVDLLAEGRALGYLFDGQERFVEHPLNGLVAAGVPVEGYIDLWVPEGPIHITDWKNTSDIKRYGKKAADILTDVQMLTYAKWANTQGLPTVKVALAYAQTKGRKHAWVTQTLTLPEIEAWWSDILIPTVSDMTKLASRDVKDFGTVQPVFGRNTCRAYNRLCPAAGWCGEEALRAAGYQTLPADMSRPPTEGAAPVPYEQPTMPTLTVVPPILEIPPGSLILFVDCAPSKSLANIPVMYLEDEIARRTPGVLAEIRATEPKLVPANAVDVQEVQFARGKGAMVASFRRTPLTGYVCARNTGLAAEIVEVLTSQAGLVIRGN